MPNLLFYPRLSTCSRRAITKTKRKWGHPHRYTPKYPLLKRLSIEFGMSIDDVYIQLMKEREILLQQLGQTNN